MKIRKFGARLRILLEKSAKKKRACVKKQKPAISFEFDSSFYTTGLGEKLKAPAKSILSRALRQIPLNPALKSEVESLMIQRIDLALKLPLTLKLEKKRQRNLRKIDIQVYNLIAGAKGKAEAERFAGLVRKYSILEAQKRSRELAGKGSTGKANNNLLMA